MSSQTSALEGGARPTEQVPYLSEVGPLIRLVMDEPPPIGVKLWLVSKYGVGYAGTYAKYMTDVVGWSPLPKLTPIQKQRLLMAGLA